MSPRAGLQADAVNLKAILFRMPMGIAMSGAKPAAGMPEFRARVSAEIQESLCLRSMRNKIRSDPAIGASSKISKCAPKAFLKPASV